MSTTLVKEENIFPSRLAHSGKFSYCISLSLVPRGSDSTIVKFDVTYDGIQDLFLYLAKV